MLKFDWKPLPPTHINNVRRHTLLIARSNIHRRLRTGKGVKTKTHSYDIRCGEGTGYILEEHFVTLCEAWRQPF